jgi:hypothetical protein
MVRWTSLGIEMDHLDAERRHDLLARKARAYALLEIHILRLKHLSSCLTVCVVQ